MIMFYLCFLPRRQQTIRKRSQNNVGETRQSSEECSFFVYEYHQRNEDWPNGKMNIVHYIRIFDVIFKSELWKNVS